MSFAWPLFLSNLLQVVYNLVDMALDMKHYVFWLGDALAGFAPFWIGLVFCCTGARKKGKAVK